ncbi:UDP-N-acetylglucosamine 1-carboxyvinyltransferase [Brevibacterium moorei]|uniref:UDP-N-acetylglucosamine 1-carboxyvinyltransferase n=1 Tax=Brevibacterium moorei TaxID=2968457 RepID=UPI00211CB1E9|nr:UDP-N-acetylglucosamine 1-carboxyvinyltransferase [Brevibacterium sp. 68QC2CO]MCQ9384806.1 UDP-N-acetylglucosamine 1-carboxyvinyltransferase [Brevibacterium sp. 68QC2CO]
MEVLRLTGPCRLNGVVEVRGAKNSVLKLMAATLLAPGRSTIVNVPAILDVTIMVRLLERLGCTIDYDAQAGEVSIDVPAAPGIRADYELVRAMRASISVLGPLVGRMGQAQVALPGGDAIGSRGLDLHEAGLKEMGAEVHLDHGYFVAAAPHGLHGTHFHLDFPSVGATENLVMAAVLADGTTVLDNAAKEPEIVDICTMLVEMGADIRGIGTSQLTISGVSELHPVTHRCVGDRIVAGSWAFAAVITGGSIEVHGAGTELLPHVFEKLETAGAVVERVEAVGGGFRVTGPTRPHSVRISTLPYPGFPTDLQPFAIALNAVADGEGYVTENLFEARWRFVNELARLGAQVSVDGNHALITGVPELSGAEVEASDIRAGAALAIAGLAATGVSEISGVSHIDRGYEFFVDKLKSLGADIERIERATVLDID